MTSENTPHADAYRTEASRYGMEAAKARVTGDPKEQLLKSYRRLRDSDGEIRT